MINIPFWITKVWKGMHWKSFKRKIMDPKAKKLCESEQNNPLCIIYTNLSLITGYAPYEAFLLRINFIKDKENVEMVDILNFKQITMVLNKLEEIITLYDAVLIEGSCMKVFCKDFNMAFKLRKIGHNSGFKYSKVIPPHIYEFPLVEIRSTERIYIPIEKTSSEYFRDLFEKILSEIIYKNKKRFLSLIEKIEKLKY